MEYDLEKRLHTRLGQRNTTWVWNVLLSQKVGGVVKKSKGLWSLFDGLPLAKWGEFEHQNKYGNRL